MADAQIWAPDVGAGASTYTVGGTVEFTLKAVNALFTDNGAAGDWLPAVVIRSDANHVIARAADQNVKVTGGDDAEVSWFPGVKNAAAAFQGLPVGIMRDIANFPIPDSTVTQIGTVTIGGNSARDACMGQATVSGSYQTLTVIQDGIYLISALTVWPAFAADRYAEIDAGGGFVFRERGSATPDDDYQVVSAWAMVFGSSPASPVEIVWNGFQASGVTQNLQPESNLIAVQLWRF